MISTGNSQVPLLGKKAKGRFGEVAENLGEYANEVLHSRGLWKSLGGWGMVGHSRDEGPDDDRAAVHEMDCWLKLSSIQLWLGMPHSALAETPKRQFCT